MGLATAAASGRRARKKKRTGTGFPWRSTPDFDDLGRDFLADSFMRLRMAAMRVSWSGSTLWDIVRQWTVQLDEGVRAAFIATADGVFNHSEVVAARGEQFFRADPDAAADSIVVPLDEFVTPDLAETYAASWQACIRRGHTPELDVQVIANPVLLGVHVTFGTDDVADNGLTAPLRIGPDTSVMCVRADLKDDEKLARAEALLENGRDHALVHMVWGVSTLERFLVRSNEGEIVQGSEDYQPVNHVLGLVTSLDRLRPSCGPDWRVHFLDGMPPGVFPLPMRDEDREVGVVLPSELGEGGASDYFWFTTNLTHKWMHDWE